MDMSSSLVALCRFEFLPALSLTDCSPFRRIPWKVSISVKATPALREAFRVAGLIVDLYRSLSLPVTLNSALSIIAATGLIFSGWEPVDGTDEAEVSA